MAWFEDALNLLSPGWVGSLIGLAGLAYALLTRKRKRISYTYLGEHLLGSGSDSLPQGITVQYQGIDIPRLTRSVVVIWNSGEETLMGSDIVSKDPLRFCVGQGGQILSISIVKSSREVNEFCLTRPEGRSDEAHFSFNYLDAKDGAVVEILHSSAKRQPRIKGTMRGLPQGLRDWGALQRRPQPKTRVDRVAGFIARLVPIMAAAPLFLAASFKPQLFPLTSVDGLLFAGVGALLASTILDMYRTRRRYPKQLHAEALE